jgi:hypothetical protein
MNKLQLKQKMQHVLLLRFSGDEFLLPTTTRYNKENSWPVVRKRTIPTERLPLVTEVVPTFADSMSRGQRNGSPRPDLGFLDRSRYFSIQVAPQLSSRG